MSSHDCGVEVTRWWCPMLMLVVPLAVIAALLYALSDFTEQRAAQRAARNRDPHSIDRQGSQVERALHAAAGVARKLARDPKWFLGWAIGTFAFFVQGAALHFGSVSVVQSLQVTTLLFAVPLSTVGRPTRPRPTDWLGGLLICAGLAVLLLVRGHKAGGVQADRPLLISALVILGASVLALVAIAVPHSGLTRPVALALAAGASFACSATLVKLTASDLTTVGVGGTARDWPGYALAAATTSGVLLQQASFATGRLATATTAMTIANPVVGTVVAAFGFHEHLAHGHAGWALVGVSAAIVIAGVSLLANSPLLRDTERSGGAGADDRSDEHSDGRGAADACRTGR